MATKYYLFWVFLVLCASFMNAVLIFVFHFMANVYARDILHEILLWNAWNVYGVVGTMLSFIAIAFWGVWMLTTPRLRSKFLVRFVSSVAIRFLYYQRYADLNLWFPFPQRWFLVMLVLAYVAFCIINQVALCSRDLKGALERKMIHDLKTTKNKTTRLEDYSHQYVSLHAVDLIPFHCTGGHKCVCSVSVLWYQKLPRLAKVWSHEAFKSDRLTWWISSNML